MGSYPWLGGPFTRRRLQDGQGPLSGRDFHGSWKPSVPRFLWGLTMHVQLQQCFGSALRILAV